MTCIRGVLVCDHNEHRPFHWAGAGSSGRTHQVGGQVGGEQERGGEAGYQGCPLCPPTPVLVLCGWDLPFVSMAYSCAAQAAALHKHTHTSSVSFSLQSLSSSTNNYPLSYNSISLCSFALSKPTPTTASGTHTPPPHPLYPHPPSEVRDAKAEAAWQSRAESLSQANRREEWARAGQMAFTALFLRLDFHHPHPLPPSLPPSPSLSSSPTQPKPSAQPPQRCLLSISFNCWRQGCEFARRHVLLGEETFCGSARKGAFQN